MAQERIKLRTAISKFYTEDPGWAEYAPSTQRGYTRSLDILMRVTSSQLNACDLRSEHIDLALKNLREGGTEEENAVRVRVGFTPRSVRSRASLGNDIKAFKALIRFLHRRQYLSAAWNPAGHLKVAPMSERRTKAPVADMIVQPDKDVIGALLEAAGRRHPRDRMVAALGLFAAYRESELLALRVSDIDLENRRIRVWRQKQKAYHTLPIRGELAQEIKRYFAWLEETSGPIPEDGFVIGSRRSGMEKLTRDGRFLPEAGPMTPMTPVDMKRPAWSVALDVKRMFENADLPPRYRVGAHTLRRMAGIYITKETGNRRNAKYLFGHKTEATTEDYLGLFDEESALEAVFNALEEKRASKRGTAAPRGAAKGRLRLAA